MSSEFSDSFERILQNACPPKVVRAVERTGDGGALWQALEETGFADALLPESLGGAGLTASQMAPIVELCGRHAVPAPFAETMVLRAVLARAGVVIPPGSLTFSGPVIQDREGIFCGQVPCGRVAGWILVACEDGARLLARGDAQQSLAASALDAALQWSGPQVSAVAPIEPMDDLLLLQALVHALQMVGAMSAVFERTLAYANERHQFGRPIGKFQAVQHQLAVMAEHVFSARMAAALAASRDGLDLDPLKIAVAKARTSEAAVEVAALSHSIHGALGFTEEYDLQLLTRRLHAWRLAAGSEAYWQSRLGAALLDSDVELTLDLVRKATELA